MKRTRLISGVVAAATVAVAAAVGLHSAYADTGGCGVQYRISNDWGTGATVDVTIANFGPPIGQWTLRWSFPANQHITNGWSGMYSQDGAAVTVVNATYNGSIATDGTATTGFNLTYSGANPAPATFSLNGQACGGPAAPSTGPTAPGTAPTVSPSPSRSATRTPSPSDSPNPSGPVVTGNATHFDGLGAPYGGCGVPQAELDSQQFVALNVYNTPGDYTTYYPRPMAASLGSKIGAWDNGRNCGRWVQVTIDDYCTGLNDGSPGQPFCRGGSWVPDRYNGATLTMLVADSCGDGNAWCRDDPNHLDLATGSLNAFTRNGVPVADLYPAHWGNRRVRWSWAQPPDYTGDLRIGFLQGAERNWPAIAITHLPNGIHGVEYYAGGSWHAAQMDSDMGQSYIIGAVQPQGTGFRIRVRDADDQLVAGGRTYAFGLPAACPSKCSAPFTVASYATDSG